MARTRAVRRSKEISRRGLTTSSSLVNSDKTKRSPRMTPAEVMAEEMFFQNVCDNAENEIEAGTTFQTSKAKIN
jgi:hypothetical protein